MASPTPPIEVHARPRQRLGMPVARFLREYWQKRPVLIRGAFTDFDNAVAPDDLAGLACEELALSRIAIHRPETDRWTLRSGPFDEADFATLPPTHWTLLVQDVDKWDADVAALLAHFDFLPSWRIDDIMISYAEDGGSVGAHVDQYDVFLLQGLGARHWQISTDPEAPTAFRDDAELRLLREFTPTHDWTLQPGDMLYLPPGVPHHGVAVGACMTYSIGMRAPSQAELLLDLTDSLAEALPESSRLTDPDLLPSKGDGEIDDAAIRRVMQTMPWLRFEHPGSGDGKRERTRAGGSGTIPAALLRTWFGRFITRYRSAHLAQPNPKPLGDKVFARACASGARVRRNPWSRCAWMREGRGALLFVAGATYPCSLRLARTICSQPEFALSTNAADQRVLRALIDDGHLALQPARGHRRPA